MKLELMYLQKFIQKLIFWWPEYFDVTFHNQKQALEVFMRPKEQLSLKVIIFIIKQNAIDKKPQEFTCKVH